MVTLYCILTAISNSSLFSSVPWAWGLIYIFLHSKTSYIIRCNVRRHLDTRPLALLPTLVDWLTAWLTGWLSFLLEHLSWHLSRKSPVVFPPLGVCWVVIWNLHFLKIQIKNVCFRHIKVESLAGKKPEFEMPPKESLFFYRYIKVQRKRALWYQKQKPNDALHFLAFSFYSYTRKYFFFHASHLSFSALHLKRKKNMNISAKEASFLHGQFFKVFFRFWFFSLYSLKALQSGFFPPLITNCLENKLPCFFYCYWWRI